MVGTVQLMREPDENTILQIMVICDLMSIVTTPKDVIQKLGRAAELLERYRRDSASPMQGQ
jgi:hypothetical protein